MAFGNIPQTKFEDTLDFIRSIKMQREKMEEEKEITESEIMEMLDVDVEKDYTKSEINEMLSKLKTKLERDVFFGSSIYCGWIRKRDQRFYEDCAKIGLAQYNAQNGTNFELDKISCQNLLVSPGDIYFHLNFIAESSDEKKHYMFFAEVVGGFEERVVSVCCILDPAAGMDCACLYCGHGVYHPRGCSFHGCPT